MGQTSYHSKNLIISVPEPKQPQTSQETPQTQRKNIIELKKSIKTQYDELSPFQDVEINKGNERDIDRLILATEDLINNCMNDGFYSGNRDEYFVNLIFIYQKLSLRRETYKIEEKMNELNKRNNIIERRQVKSEEQSNNLVYNILGFIASFSIVSAAVAAINQLEGIENVVLFMAFTIFILLTTLIALHNFYKNTNRIRSSLQDNYFLWKMILAVIILIIMYRGIIYIQDNKQEVFEYIGRGIGQVVNIEDINKEN